MVEQLKNESKIDIEWKPFYLHPEWPSEGISLPSYVRERHADMYKRLEDMAAEIGLPMVRLDKLPNSRLPLEASEYAREHGKHEEFHRVVFRKLYGEGQDISKWEILRGAAKEVGLDADAMQRDTDNGNYRTTLEVQLEKARALGINSVPTYIINDKHTVVGAQPYGVFERILKQLSQDHN